MPANSLATFFRAVYPDPVWVEQSQPDFGDPVNILQPSLVCDGGSSGIDPKNVREGFVYDGGTKIGTFAVATPQQTLRDVGYGAERTEFVGTLTAVPYGSTGIDVPVLSNGQLDSPLCIGRDYVAIIGTAFVWQIAAPTGFTASDSITFTGKPLGDECEATTSWTVTTQPTDNLNGTWTLSFDLPAAATSVIEPGCYAWEVSLDNGTQSTSVETGQVEWECC